MHPFARFIQILGKGRNGMRPLTQEEAYAAMSSTLALVLRVLGLAKSPESAHDIAAIWWRERHQYTSVKEAV